MELLERKRLLCRIGNVGTGGTFIWKSEPWIVISDTSLRVDSKNHMFLF